MSFTTVPVLPLSQARDPDTKPAFLEKLRDTLLNVGFLYLSETGLPEDLVRSVCEGTKEFFDEGVLPVEEKERIEMKNEKSFLGWSKVSGLFLPVFLQDSRDQSGCQLKSLELLLTSLGIMERLQFDVQVSNILRKFGAEWEQ